MVVEDMEIDDYQRDRSRSPKRDDEGSRSRSPPARDRSPRRNFDRRPTYRDSYRSSSYRDSRSRDQKDNEYRAKTERNHGNSIFIGNLPFNCEWHDLKDHFKAVGEIIRADIVTNHGKSRGMGTVEFTDKESVQKAIDEFNHTEFLSREIFVRQDYPPPESKRDRYDERRSNRRYEERRYDDRRSNRYEERRSFDRRTINAPPPPPEGCEIFVGNLPFRTNWQDLKDLFRNVGDVTRADVRLDDRGRSRGFGTVIFSNKEDAEKAIETYQGYEIDGRKIDIRAGNSGKRIVEEDLRPKFTAKKNSEFTEDVVGDGEPSETIFADNLPFATANEDLFDLFETVGKVEKAEIKYNSDGRASGSAVVRFTNADDAASAIQKLNNYEYGNRPLKLSYAKLP
ncbi:hypothetical protein PACTADRAFT_33497 [Pachysolen tannophilus NRRL Y-2460]|uniref:RRM domain-containing protein n=1 Tax=Pachysolen tannophilus NRRL Y-2460 TaxID=669874 RepID=A0A1E4TX72_PACTA|nr:hypothetical protein PACTADRAFT_33497 [Pachysolen tannophilus NRRL Y-2460]